MKITHSNDQLMMIITNNVISDNSKEVNKIIYCHVAHSNETLVFICKFNYSNKTKNVGLKIITSQKLKTLIIQKMQML